MVLLYFRFQYIHGIWLTASRTEKVYTSIVPSHDSSAKSRWEFTSKVRVLQNDSLFISTYLNSQHRYRKLNSLRELNIPACKKYKTVLHQSQLCCSFRRNISNNCYQRMFRIQLIFQYDTYSECKNTHTHTQCASTHTCSLQTYLHRTAYIHSTHIRAYRTHIYMRTYTHSCINICIHTYIHVYMHNECITCTYIHTGLLISP